MEESRASVLTDDLVEPLNDLVQDLRRHAAQASSDALDRERSYLADFHPGLLRQVPHAELQGQRKAGALRLTGKRYRDDRAGALIEHIVAEDQNRARSCLLAPFYGVELGPTALSSQYSGHSARSRSRPSSASACSALGSSLAHSRASRERSSRASFSSTAC